MWMYSHFCQVEEQHCLSHLLTLTWSPLRYAHPGDPPAGHTAHAGQRAAALLLRLLHIWHRGRPALGRPPQKPLLCGWQLSHVSILFSSQYLIHVFVRRDWSAWWLGCSLFCFVLFCFQYSWKPHLVLETLLINALFLFVKKRKKLYWNPKMFKLWLLLFFLMLFHKSTFLCGIFYLCFVSHYSLYQFH